MQEAEPCMKALLDLADRPKASEDEIDAVLHSYLCGMLDDAARLAVADYVSDQADYEAIRDRRRSAFWNRVLVVALDKHRIMTSQSS